jgi:Uma2 family endonuclease
MNIEQATTQVAQMTAPARLSAADLTALGDIGSYELIEGELVPVSPTKPRHGRIESLFDRLLGAFVDEHDLGEVQVGEVGIFVGREPDTIRAADVLFISHERLARATPDSFLDVAPELVVEILSPDDRWSQVKRKLRDYFEAGVDVVLVVDPEERTISAYRSMSEVQEFTEENVLVVEDVLPGFSVAVGSLFARGKRG